jgi:hypothetical protein
MESVVHFVDITLKSAGVAVIPIGQSTSELLLCREMALSGIQNFDCR